MIALAAMSAGQAQIMAAIHRQAFEAPWSTEAFVSVLEGPGVFALGATVAGADEPVGFILCRVAADEAEILTLATAPEHRRRGVAGALLEAANAAAARSGAALMFLEVAEDNPAAQALYLVKGFRQVGLRPGYYQRAEGDVQARIMSRDLNR
jgi:ribosomal-protein-alanine N-acetyltransferase